MSRGRKMMLAAMVAAAVWCAGVAFLGGDGAVTAQMAQVTLGEVHRVVALGGSVDFSGSHGAYAAWPGRVAEVYVQPGQRVKAGQALIRLEGSVPEQAASAWAAQETGEGSGYVRQLLDGCVIRAPENAVVRQVLAQPYAPVQAGEPVALLSGSDQVIRCIAVQRDAREVQPGMDAAILLGGETVGTAEVTQVGAAMADASTGAVVCQITLAPDQPLALPQGAAVVAEVTVAKAEGVPVLPLSAFTARETLWWVHDGICTEIPAEIVLSDEMQAWVNLPEGIRVALGEFTQGQQVREAEP